MNKGVNFQLSATNNAQGAFTSFNKGLASVNQAANTNRVLMRSMNAGMNSNRRAVQQLGFQMSDFAIQVAGGQSAMLAFVQQGGQILQFFGPFGAVMAALLAVFGSLYIAMTKTGTAIDSLYPYLGVLEEEFRLLVDAIKAVIGVAADMGIWIVHNLDLIIITASVAVGFFTVQWVAGMIAASAATWTLTGALAALRVALIRVGIGALIVAVGYLIERFLTLVRGAGSVGEAFRLMGDAGLEVLGALRQGVALLGEALRGLSLIAASMFAKIKAGFVESLASITGLQMNAAGIALRTEADMLSNNATEYYKSIGESFNGLVDQIANGPAVRRLRDAVNAGEVTPPAWTTGTKPGETGGGGGGAVDRAKEDAEKIKTVFDDMQQSISGSLMSSFKALTQGTKSFAEATFDLLSDIANKIIDILMTPVFNSLAGGIAKGLGGIIPGLGASFGLPSFDGGGFTGMGARAGGLDGRGGRLAVLHPNETVLDHTKGQGTGGQPIVVNMTINSPDAESFRKSRGQIEAEIARAVQSGARNR